MRWPLLMLTLFACLALTAGCSRQKATPISSPTPLPTFTSQGEETSRPTLQAPPSPTVVPTSSTPVDPGTLARDRQDMGQEDGLPALRAREERFRAVLASERPILLLEDSLSEDQHMAQIIAADDENVRRLASDVLGGGPLRTEVMIVRPLLPSDESDGVEDCAPDVCYRVELYNYPMNLTIVALVDVAEARVLDVSMQNNTQPEIPMYLADLAAQIAINAPEVREALGFDPTADQAAMPNVKTALNGSLCERSRHLCVAPTFLLEDRALWAIVDLTDGRLVGTRWTDLGGGGGVPVTEQNLQDSVVMAIYCQRSIPLAQDNWEMEYMLTSSDGLAIIDASYNGRPVIRSLKIPDWHVSYSGTDGFGYSDAVGCPMFSTASVVAFNGPQIEAIVETDEAGNESEVGFAIVQDFRSELWPLPCNYRYEQRYEFYADGRFRFASANLGQGCGNNGTYRPVLRIDLVAADGGRQTFAEWDGDNWQPWSNEGWTLQDDATAYTTEGYQLRITAEEGGGFYVEPNRGQFDDDSRGDFAYAYATVHKPDEGDADLITIGPCCNEDHEQGPERFMDPPESLEGDNTDVVLWYVPQLENDDTPGEEYCWTKTEVVEGELKTAVYPCVFGPMFVPVDQESPDE